MSIDKAYEASPQQDFNKLLEVIGSRMELQQEQYQQPEHCGISGCQCLHGWVWITFGTGKKEYWCDRGWIIDEQKKTAWACQNCKPLLAKIQLGKDSLTHGEFQDKIQWRLSKLKKDYLENL